jgi:hypothetical protein
VPKASPTVAPAIGIEFEPGEGEDIIGEGRVERLFHLLLLPVPYLVAVIETPTKAARAPSAILRVSGDEQAGHDEKRAQRGIHARGSLKPCSEIAHAQYCLLQKSLPR